MAITKPGENQEFTYTGGMQTFVVPQSGLYMLEVWGAQGGDYGMYDVKSGGLGGYSKGYAVLKKGDVLYICVGGSGRFKNSTDNATGYPYGGYNGGGYGNGSGNKSSGGGATHIGVFNSTLAAHGNTDGLYIVAGGGGGASGGPDGNSNPNGYGKSNGGTGGGLSGSNGGASVYNHYANGGTQKTGDSFGKGGDVGGPYAGAGGGGLYGGQAGEQSGSGGGGSGYIGGVPEITYKGQEYAPETKNGAHSGNGKARITFVEKSISLVFAGRKEIIAIYCGNRRIADVKISGGGQK